MVTDYQPKHMKNYRRDGMTHCCFAGCTPMGCPGGCCVQEFGHRADCPLNPSRQMDEAMHDLYVNQGLRKHLAPPPPPIRRCGCGEEIVNGRASCWGPSGCINRPA